MQHKDKKRIGSWLKDLREKHYVEWIYSTHFAEKTKPAIYYIGINGVRFLKTRVWDDGSGDVYPLTEIRKRYRESSRSRTFIDRCILIADCGITLEASSTNKKQYSFVTEADYRDPDSTYHFLGEAEHIRPNLCFIRQENAPGGSTSTNYLLEVFDTTLPRYRLKKRLKDYLTYIEDGEWESETGDDESPIILLACPRTTDLIYAKRRTRGLMAETWERKDEGRPHIRFATTEKLKEFGVTGRIWEEA